MSPVKNQEYCGSCYAFATTAVLEYHSWKAGNQNIYSEQDLMDCDTATHACDGNKIYLNLDGNSQVERF